MPLVLLSFTISYQRTTTLNSTDSALCRTCGDRYISFNQITGCGAWPAIWEWTRERIARILRTDTCQIHQEWILKPQFHIWPQQRNRAVLWTLAHIVSFRMREFRVPSVQEYSDFLRSMGKKTSQKTRRFKQVGNY